MKVEVLSESSEQYKKRSTAKNCKTPFPGYRIVTYDFEYISVDGERPNPVCLVWHDWESGKTHRIWQDELLKMKEPPFDISERTICFTYYYGAEGSCHQALGWEHPTNVIDCFTEFRNRTNGAKVPCGNSLIGATPELLEKGIPDDAFKPVTGDDKKVAAAVRKRNKKERSGQLTLWRMTMLETMTDLEQWHELNSLAEDQPQLAERRYAEYRVDPSYRNAKFVADLWTAAFFWPLTEDNDLIPTEEVFRQAQADVNLVPEKIKMQVAQLAERHKFFHWHQEFPDVFGKNDESGFDVVLGNSV